MYPFLQSQIRVITELITELIATIERGDLGPISSVARNEIRRALGKQPAQNDPQG